MKKVTIFRKVTPELAFLLKKKGPDERNSQHADADHGPDGRAAWVGLTKELVGDGRSFSSVFLPKARSRIKIRGPFFEHKQIRGGINVMAIIDHILGVLFLVLIVDTWCCYWLAFVWYYILPIRGFSPKARMAHDPQFLSVLGDPKIFISMWSNVEERDFG